MKTLTLNNRTFLAVKCPMGVKNLTIDVGEDSRCFLRNLDFQDIGGKPAREIALPIGTYSEPFLLSRVDEERAKGMMDVEQVEHFSTPTYRDYEKGGTVFKEPGKKGVYLGYDTALESFHSWLRANGVYTENPMGEIEPAVMDIDRFPLPICMEPREEQKELYLRSEGIALIRKQWHHYQSQVSKEWIFVEQLKSK